MGFHPKLELCWVKGSKENLKDLIRQLLIHLYIFKGWICDKNVDVKERARAPECIKARSVHSAKDNRVYKKIKCAKRILKITVLMVVSTKVLTSTAYWHYFFSGPGSVEGLLWNISKTLGDLRSGQSKYARGNTKLNTPTIFCPWRFFWLILRVYRERAATVVCLAQWRTSALWV